MNKAIVDKDINELIRIHLAKYKVYLDNDFNQAYSNNDVPEMKNLNEIVLKVCVYSFSLSRKNQSQDPY